LSYIFYKIIFLHFFLCILLPALFLCIRESAFSQSCMMF